MNPGEVNQYCTELIIERTVELSQGELSGAHPTVLSCGGIFVPRPRPINPLDPLYHVLNTPNDGQPTKIVSALFTSNLLDEVSIKESAN